MPVITIRDVAADAGVAVSTVSYALSGRKKLPEATVRKVQASATKLGYRPSSTGKALALGRTNVLGMMVQLDTHSPETDIDVFMWFVRAAVYTAKARGYDLMIVGRDDDALAGDMLVDALVVMSIRAQDTRVPHLSERGKPAVLIGVPDDTHGLSAVDLDFEDAGRVAARHLAALGHRSVTLVSHPVPVGDDFAFSNKLQHGFFDESKRLGLTATFRQVGASRADVAAWLDEVKDSQPGLTGIFLEAVASLDALYEELGARGLSVPGDVSIVALAPAKQFARLFPATTLIDLPGDEMVRRAVTLALDELSGGVRGVVELLPAVLHDHGSSGPARTDLAR